MNEIAKTKTNLSDSNFISHIADWEKYLSLLIFSSDDDLSYKYERQLKWLLVFKEGLNASVKHNLLLDDIYGDSNLNAYTPSNLVDFDPIQKCYLSTPIAFKEIKKAMAASNLFFLQGPPGTGKTTAIVEIVLQTLKEKPDARILISAETHIAVDNALDKIISILGPEYSDITYRHKAFHKDSELSSASASKAELNSKAHDVFNKAWKNNNSLTDSLLDRFNIKSDSIPNWVAKNISDNSQIVGVTCNQIDNIIDNNSDDFDLAIIDEVSKATLPEWIIALCNAVKVILVGDHKQLPATFCQEESEVLGALLKRQEILIRDGVIDKIFVNSPEFMKGMLTTQYRMQPNIGAFISDTFYDGQLSHGRVQNEDENANFGWLSYKRTELCPNTELPKERQVLTNDSEIKIIEESLKKLDGLVGKSTKVALITPYKKQCSGLRRMKDNLSVSNLVIEVATVDAFQGREADVVFFSFVRNNGSARFYGDSRRINVAISRARDRVYLVGDRDYLRAQKKYLVLKELLKLKTVTL